MATATDQVVTDMGDWTLVVPFRIPLNLTGSRLTATMTGQWGGPAVVNLDSAAGSIAWTADANGLTDHIVITVPASARGDWLATGPNGLPGKVSVFFDVMRTVTGSTRVDPLGRSSVVVFPGTGSPAVLAAGGSFQPVLAALPCSGVVLPALATGPQGPPGPSSPAAAAIVAALIFG
ncbi:hypothetical protein [Methylobacterium sp. GC_Met_2]|uniref:hypothetical protein n=1 Tax=Methylobacterium sp. GC_Met_2 TaxID=2937376 RepID=UPI00226B112E|nr:hypothetical protein [Methylobacterium sp. GC_Met_2]